MELEILTINRERQRRGLPTGLNNPEAIAQAEMLSRGMTVDQIFRDNISNPAFDSLIQSKIDRGVPANQIQAELAQQGLNVPLYRIQELGGQNNIQDFSNDIISLDDDKKDKVVKENFLNNPTDLDDNQIRLAEKGNVITVSENEFQDRLNKLTESELLAIYNTLDFGPNLKNILQKKVDARTPGFGRLDDLNKYIDEDFQDQAFNRLTLPSIIQNYARVAARVYGPVIPAIERFFMAPEDRRLQDVEGFKTKDEFIFGGKSGGRFRSEVDALLTGFEERPQTEQGFQSEIDRLISYQAGPDETVVVAEKLTPPEDPIDPDKIDFGVDKPTDPTKIKQEDIEAEQAEVEQGGKINKEGKDVTPTPSPTPAPSPATDADKDKLSDELETKNYGQALARFFSALGTQSKANTLTDALSGAAATFAATEAARSEKIRQEERDLMKELKKIVAKEQASGGDFKVSDLFNVNDAKSKINEEIGFYEGGEQAISFMNQAIALFEQAKRDGVATFFNIPKSETSAATDIKTFIDIVKQKNIKDILNESGRTISNIDRQILDSIFGDLDLTTPASKTLDKLKASRENLITNQRTRKRTISSINATLSDPILRGRGRLGIENMTLLEKVLAADPANPLLQFNQTSESLTKPVFNLTGQQIN
jgi:hypothetical protein